MTIRPGAEWGHPALSPLGIVDVADDAALGALVESFRRSGRPLPPVRLNGGDLARTLGALPGPPAVAPGTAGRLLPVDVGRAEIDGEPHWFVAHLVARRSWWRGAIVAVMNTEHRGTWDVTRRGHPNDGRLDVVEVAPTMNLRQRCQATRRLPTGTHVPHPAITERRVSSAEWRFPRPLRITLDGRPHGSATHLRVVCEPDALEVFVPSG